MVFPLRRCIITSLVCVSRLQELEDQYRKEREEANNLLEQQRLVLLYIILYYKSAVFTVSICSFKMLISCFSKTLELLLLL